MEAGRKVQAPHDPVFSGTIDTVPDADFPVAPVETQCARMGDGIIKSTVSVVSAGHCSHFVMVLPIDQRGIRPVAPHEWASGHRLGVPIDLHRVVRSRGAEIVAPFGESEIVVGSWVHENGYTVYRHGETQTVCVSVRGNRPEPEFRTVKQN